jgi:hypothetical protein
MVARNFQTGLKRELQGQVARISCLEDVLCML